MRRHPPPRTAAFALACLLAACGGGARPTAPPPDEALSQDFTTGRDSMSLDRYPEAADAYRSAYRRALADDDARAIGAAGTDLAIALVAADDPDAALRTAATTRADLGIRQAAIPFELDLAEAAALLRLGRAAQASAVVAPAENAPDAAVAERAAFLRGLAASESGDLATLHASFERLGPPTAGKTVPTVFAADRAELRARLAASENDYGSELAAALDAVRLRRDASDDRGMRRALSLASTAARRLGRGREADDLAIQARQSRESARPPQGGADGVPAIP